MYRIGEFSKITNLTVKTLRYYDEEGILRPAVRDEDTGYRFYDARDYEKAQLIHLLKTLEFSIAEIKDVLNQHEDDLDLSYFIKEKKEMLEEKISHLKSVQKKMEAYLLPEKGDQKMNYEVKIKETQPIKAASLRYRGKYEETGHYLGQLFKKVKFKANGKPFSLYYDADFKDFDADIEVCIPVKSEVSGKDVKTRTLPERKVLSATHIGPYETISNAYKALTDYAKENEIEYEVPFREIYHKTPGVILKGNPNKYETEIQFLIKH
ncbi:MerR family transcriptional regulator [Bacillus sp. PAMC26568]|nr:MerR family transcriptional regulator [Bacillus sp. PAMC26568]